MNKQEPGMVDLHSMRHGSAGTEDTRPAGTPEDATVESWRRQYPMPDENKDGSNPSVKMLYRPPRSDIKGVLMAMGVLSAYAALFYHGLWQIKLSGPGASPWWDVAGTFFALEFVCTGLFITTHDAMHGTICFRNRPLNDFLGWLCISLYAWFDYDMLHKKHWEHHNFTGQPHKDPDFHRGKPKFLPWFVSFMMEYSTTQQYIKIMSWVAFLLSLRVPMPNLMLYLAAAPILAAVRLFYFGTYLPHLPPSASEIMDWPKSHSAGAPSWLSFLKCYHFDYHWEHHRWPYAPWWELPKCKAITRGLKLA